MVTASAADTLALRTFQIERTDVGWPRGTRRQEKAGQRVFTDVRQSVRE
jgi:hypothetical protein